MRLLLGCVIAAGLVVSVAAKDEERDSRSGERSFKGWELYGWQDNGEWRFSLLFGTNRLKFCAEVKNPEAALDLERAVRALDRLAEVETVTFVGPVPAFGNDCELRRPPDDMVARLRRTCEVRSLQCSGW